MVCRSHLLSVFWVNYQMEKKKQTRVGARGIGEMEAAWPWSGFGSPLSSSQSCLVSLSVCQSLARSFVFFRLALSLLLVFLLHLLFLPFLFSLQVRLVSIFLLLAHGEENKSPLSSFSLSPHPNVSLVYLTFQSAYRHSFLLQTAKFTVNRPSIPIDCLPTSTTILLSLSSSLLLTCLPAYYYDSPDRPHSDPSLSRLPSNGTATSCLPVRKTSEFSNHELRPVSLSLHSVLVSISTCPDQNVLSSQLQYSSVLFPAYVS
ncbi:hypothetical protein BO82DRAFT_31104 [Aspergillus uvarum CBS 121591]|uniref:Uncharacterized protein n=1 Tax=Aspergillus uvarum CBS 121591 TaxID=1448315 RepID=A0A319DYS0_9EURO|nr:hypothetical protein BO82DRAFT_31104 [Aspergillus uvarum CBS 121591]PYH84042.1 hypothetical protein BO82DRAFT_31104 [Aspergillus uvarum CBS 121591]